MSAFGQGSEISGGRPAGTSYGSARVPQPDGMRTTQPADGPPRGTASPYGPVSPANAASPYGPVSPSGSVAPFRPAAASSSTGGAPRFGAVPGSASAFPPPVPGGSAPPEEPRSAWAPTPAPQQAERESFARPDVSPPQWAAAAPLPQRNPATPPELVEFDGFAAGNPARGGAAESADLAQRDDIDPGTGRPPGISAFGDQRVRVPGAALAELPDAPQSVRAGFTGESAAFPARVAEAGDSTDAGSAPQGIANGAFPTRRGDTGGVPLRSPAGVEAEFSPHPAGGLPIRSQQAPYGAPPSDQPARFEAPERSPGPAPESFSAFGSRDAEDAPHPYARAIVPDAPGPRSAVPSAEPFGHGSGTPREAFFDKPAEEAAYRRAEPPVSGSGSARVPTGSVSGPSGEPADSPSPSAAFAGSGSVPSDPTGMPGGALAESRNGSVPQPRDPAERPAPAVGSARPVTASASVPSASRVAPVELPPSAASQARVYGRPVQTDADDNRPPESPAPPPFQGGGEDQQQAPPPGNAPHSGAAPATAGSAFRATAPFVERERADDLSAFRPAPIPVAGSDDRNGRGSAGTPAYGAQPGEDQHRPTDLASASAPGNVHGRADDPGAPIYPAQPSGDPNRPAGFGPVGFGSPAYPNQPDPNAPQSPARATARASASARVGPAARARPALRRTRPPALRRTRPPALRRACPPALRRACPPASPSTNSPPTWRAAAGCRRSRPSSTASTRPTSQAASSRMCPRRRCRLPATGRPAGWR